MVDDWKGPPRTLTMKRTLVAAADLAAMLAAGWFGLHAWAVYKAQSQIRAQLKDPESALFEQVSYFRVTGAVCGAVNAKNSFGGYVGFRPFVLDRHGLLTWGAQGDPADKDLDRRLAALREAIEFRKLLDAQCPGIGP